MRTFKIVGAIALAALATTACKKKAEAPVAEPVDLRTQVAAVISPIEPVEGLDPKTVHLGARLYHDPNLSADGTISCASCHVVTTGGHDGLSLSPGVGGAMGNVNSPTVLNSHLNFVQFWDGRAKDLAEQALGPIENPVEMANTLDAVVEYLRSEPSYVELFGECYDGTITAETLADAIATYEKTLTTPNGRFDQWLRGDDKALNEVELAGLQAFVDTGCIACHVGPGLGGTMYQKMGVVNSYFEGREIDEASLGRFNVTQNESDRHRFKVPLLRNIARTAPYFHDGSVDSLDEAVRVMAHLQVGMDLTDEEVTSITAFLHTLDGELPTVDIAELNLPPARAANAADNEEAAPSADQEDAQAPN